jgi:hypothetical protein
MLVIAGDVIGFETGSVARPSHPSPPTTMRVPALITFLALVVRAAPVAAAEDLLVLTKDDFKSVTAKGVWSAIVHVPCTGG